MLKTCIFLHLFILIILFTIIPYVFSFLSRKYKCNQEQLVQYINKFCLPQIQCKKCGYQDCKSYAYSIVKKKESVNKCLPGGMQTKLKILDFLNFKLIEKNLTFPQYFYVVRIKEEECIGCNKCAQICPSNAIIGTIRSIHTIVYDLCIGCNLCVDKCPVKCIKTLKIIVINNK